MRGAVPAAAAGCLLVSREQEEMLAKEKVAEKAQVTEAVQAAGAVMVSAQRSLEQSALRS